MKKKWWILPVSIVGCLAVVMIVIIAMGGSGKKSGYYAEYSSAAFDYARNEAKSTAAEYGAYAEEDYVEAPMEAEESYAKEEAYDENYNGVDVDEEAVRKGEKLIYSADISLETKAYKKHRDFLYSLSSQYGVIIEDMSENSYDTVKYGSFTLRVPYENFAEVYQLLTSDDEGWSVMSASSRVENMTKQYSKLTAQIEAYEAEKEALLALLKEAATVSETLEIQDRLAWLNSDLQYYYNQRNDIDEDVEMSTIRVRLQEVWTQVEKQKPILTFGERVDNAFAYSKQRLVDGLENTAIWFVENWIGIIAFLVFAAIVLAIIRKVCKKHRNKKAAKNIVEAAEEATEEK